MNFGQGCVSILWWAGVFGVSGILLYYVYKTDVDFGETDGRRVQRLWLVYSTVTGFVLGLHSCDFVWIIRIAYALLAVYFVVCSVMDAMLKMVCDFFHGIGLIGGCVYLAYIQPRKEALEVIILFVGIQWFVFRKMYGPADMTAYVICSMYLAAEDYSLLNCLLHMLVTFGILGPVQLWKRNISAKGNLKNPVALLPYIAGAFFLII